MFKEPDWKICHCLAQCLAKSLKKNLSIAFFPINNSSKNIIHSDLIFQLLSATKINCIFLLQVITHIQPLWHRCLYIITQQLHPPSNIINILLCPLIPQGYYLQCGYPSMEVKSLGDLKGKLKTLKKQNSLKNQKKGRLTPTYGPLTVAWTTLSNP